MNNSMTISVYVEFVLGLVAAVILATIFLPGTASASAVEQARSETMRTAAVGSGSPADEVRSARAKSMMEQRGVQSDVAVDTDLISQSATMSATTSATTTPPGYNAFSCDRVDSQSTSSATVGTSTACYGMWDYGNSFGGDEYMCGWYGFGVSTGCVITTAVCQSGTALATQYYSNRDLRSLPASSLATIASRLETTTNIVREEVAGLWEYSCL